MKWLCLILFSSFLGIDISGQVPCSADFKSLEVVVNGLSSSEGNVALQLMSDGEVLDELFVEINEKRAVHVFEKLLAGEYHIRCFHDENGNRSMDTNFMGIPKEGYGFSNNAKGFMGPPADTDCMFKVEKSLETHQITMRYL